MMARVRFVLGEERQSLSETWKNTDSAKTVLV
jgi:hypothetical protein